MSVDEKAAKHVKQFYNDPKYLLETYEAYRDGYKDGRNDMTLSDKIIFTIIGFPLAMIMLAIVDILTHHSIFK